MRLGYTTGVFDLFHIGHLNLLRNARSLCDRLIVGVTSDELLLTEKHKHAVIPHEERMEIVRSIRHVDAVVAQHTMNKMELWERLHFDVMFVGDDWYDSPRWRDIEADFDQVGVKVVYFPYTTGTSSTLINAVLEERRSRMHADRSEQTEQATGTPALTMVVPG